MALMGSLLLGACATPRQEQASSRDALRATPESTAAAERPQPPGPVTVRTHEGTYAAPSVMLVATFLASPPMRLLLVSVRAESGSGAKWHIVMGVDETFLKTKRATARLIPAQGLGPGLALVEFQSGSGPWMVFADGTLELTATGQEVRGTARPKSGSEFATFEGPLTLECWVPPEWLNGAGAQGAPPPTPVASEPEEMPVRVLDTALATPQCQAMADALR
ncbi:hypothetical protein FOF48_30190 [Corallococcus sp. Z5C101001]|nr:hypothetical protein [Corallococcus silvisoli]TSC23373.1 hypothetical protein FOF48_30190 [Corallococcus sp. Z5C101001]